MKPHQLPKTHAIDARCISGNPNAEGLSCIYYQKCVRAKNRQIHKATIGKGGVRKLNQAPRYVFGFQLFDKVEHLGQECFIFGRRASGCFLLKKLGNPNFKAEVTHKKLKLLEKRKTILAEKEVTATPLTTKVASARSL